MTFSQRHQPENNINIAMVMYTRIKAQRTTLNRRREYLKKEDNNIAKVMLRQEIRIIRLTIKNLIKDYREVFGVVT